MLHPSLTEAHDLLGRLATLPYLARDVRTQFDTAHVAVGAALDQLGRLDGLNFDEVLDTEEAEVAETVDPWFHHRDRAELYATRRQDPLVDGLIRGGLTPVEAWTLGPNTLTCAEILGSDIDVLSGWLRVANAVLREARAKQKKGQQLKSRDLLVAFSPPKDGGARRRLHKALNRLAKQGVLTDPIPSDRSTVMYKPRWKVRLTTDLRMHRMLTGEWLTAWAAIVVRDHFERLDAPLHSLCLFRAEAASDLGRWRAEADLIALAEVDGEKKLLWIECKAGNPARVRPARLGAQRRGLLQVLKRLGRTGLAPSFVCVVPPAHSKSDREAKDTLCDALAPEGFDLVDTRGLRAWLEEAVSYEDPFTEE